MGGADNLHTVNDDYHYLLRMGKTIYSFFSFYSSPIPTIILLFTGKFYDCGEAGKGLLWKKGGGENEKGENGFPPFFPQILSFHILSPTARFPLMDHGENGFPYS